MFMFRKKRNNQESWFVSLFNLFFLKLRKKESMFLTELKFSSSAHRSEKKKYSSGFGAFALFIYYRKHWMKSLRAERINKSIFQNC